MLSDVMEDNTELDPIFLVSVMTV